MSKWSLGEVLAVTWNPEMTARFPTAEHTFCRVDSKTDRCVDLHCNRCGQPTDCQGGHDCPDRADR